MAITYTNVIQDNVIDSLNTLLSDEFSVPIYYDEHKGNQSFLLTPSEDSAVSFTNNSSTRSYSFEISYQIASGGVYHKNKLKQVTEIAERVKRLIHNNSSYSPSSVDKWIDARIETINYEKDENKQSAVMEFICTSVESL